MDEIQRAKIVLKILIVSISKEIKIKWTARDIIIQYEIDKTNEIDDIFGVVEFLTISKESDIFSEYFEKNFVLVIFFRMSSNIGL